MNVVNVAKRKQHVRPNTFAHQTLRIHSNRNIPNLQCTKIHNKLITDTEKSYFTNEEVIIYYELIIEDNYSRIFSAINLLRSIPFFLYKETHSHNLRYLFLTKGRNKIFIISSNENWLNALINWNLPTRKALWEKYFFNHNNSNFFSNDRIHLHKKICTHTSFIY